MIKDGKGGARTVTGLHFESRVSLKEVISALKGYSVSDNEVHFEGKLIAKFYPKHDLYKNLLEPKGVDYLTIISKKLLPDDAILVMNNNTLYIVEIKFQEVAGSVDEKLQTCDFKNKQYTKLLASLHIKVEYVYVLGDWFKKPEYADVLKYIKSVGCHYYFTELPLDFLGLPKPKLINNS